MTSSVRGRGSRSAARNCPLWHYGLYSLAWGFLCLHGLVAWEYLDLRGYAGAGMFADIGLYAALPVVLLSAWWYCRTRVRWWGLAASGVLGIAAECDLLLPNGRSLLDYAMIVMCTPAFVVSWFAIGLLAASILNSIGRTRGVARRWATVVCVLAAVAFGTFRFLQPSSGESAGFGVYLLSALVALYTAVCYGMIWLGEVIQPSVSDARMPMAR